MAERRQKFAQATAASSRAVRWLLENLKPDGSFGVEALMPHYKAPLVLGSAGYVDEADRVFSWITKTYTGPDWHTRDPKDVAANARECDLYEDLWLAWGAVSVGRDYEAMAIYGLCESLQDVVTGGIRSHVGRVPEASSVCDLRSTALAGLVGLVLGREETVNACGRFTIRLLDDQPDPSRGFFLVRDTAGDLVTAFPADRERVHVVGYPDNQTNPLYYALSLAMTFLALLYREGGDREALRGAREFAELCRMRADGILRHHYTGKLCWGMALMHELTGVDLYRTMAVRASEYLLDNQLDDGSWRLPTLYPDPIAQPREATLDRTAEYAHWLRLFAQTAK